MERPQKEETEIKRPYREDLKKRGQGRKSQL
jgi:hypothetical protein